MASSAASYDVLKDYEAEGCSDFSSVGDHLVAVFRLSDPVTYDRFQQASGVSVLSGSLLRKQEPLLLREEVIQLNIGASKRSSVGNLSATIKTDKNLLSADAPLPGDWIMAWQAASPGAINNVAKALKEGRATNGFSDGLKFVGRVEDIQKHSVISNGVKTVTYAISAISFDELSQPLFYDVALGDIELKQDVWRFLSRVSSDITKAISSMIPEVGKIQNNSEAIVDVFVDIVLGSGTSKYSNQSLKNAGGRCSGGFRQPRGAVGGWCSRGFR